MHANGTNAIRPLTRAAGAVIRTALALSVLVWVSACRREARPVTATWTAMGTYASLTLPAAQRPRLAAWRETVESTLREIERELSVWDAASTVAAINRRAGGDWTPLPARVRAVLDASLAHARATDGAFDPTVGPLMDLWGFRGAAPPREPEAAAIVDVMRRVGYALLERDPRGARLAVAGARLDLGAIGKGFAVDQAYELLAARGCAQAMINLGGNLRVRGHAGTRPWRVGIRDPFHPYRQIAVLDLRHGEAVATSGNYEQFVKLDGVRHTHIMDPRTGRPVRGMAGVTVLAPTATLADVLSTALFVAGLEGAADILAAYPDVQALLIADEGDDALYATEALLERLRLEDAARSIRTL